MCVQRITAARRRLILRPSVGGLLAAAVGMEGESAGDWGGLVLDMSLGFLGEAVQQRLRAAHVVFVRGD
jgi:hypothetical protein